MKALVLVGLIALYGFVVLSVVFPSWRGVWLYPSPLREVSALWIW